MAVKIRLRQQGRKNRQTFRLIACDKHVKRDGKYLENLGWYDPYLAEKNAKFKEESILKWLDQGAEMSEEAKNLIARIAPNVIKHWNEKKSAKRAKVAASRRKSRKEKAAKAAPAVAAKAPAKKAAPKKAAAPKKKAAPKKTAAKKTEAEATK